MADFIITSLQSWNIEIGSTIKNTAMEISKNHRVFYINTPVTLMQWMHGSSYRTKKKDMTVNGNLRVINCNIPALPVNRMPFKWLFSTVNYFNNYCIARAIRKAILRYEIKDFIHIIDTDIFRSRYLKRLIRPEVSIYYRRDYVIGVDYWKKYGVECERKLVKESDIIITNSSYFTEELASFNSNIYTTNTGVNLTLYDSDIRHTLPADLAAIPSPIIGYTGAVIERRLDSELLYSVAQQLPAYSFVFVGPEDDHFSGHPLHRLDNVYFLGRKEVKELPQYIQHFQVCINPQRINPITEGNYPLKIDEYLAMGKPVVATSTHTMRDVFSRYTHLANSEKEWVRALKTCVLEADDSQLRAARIAFAHTHSWAHSVEKIYAAIEEYKRGNQQEIS